MPPTATSPVVDGDWSGSYTNSGVSTSAGFSTDEGSYGSSYDDKLLIQSFPFQALMHFELELPDGATVIGVRLSVVARPLTATDSENVVCRLGLIARDGIWDATDPSGFTEANYATVASLPGPVVRTASVYEYNDSEWHGGVAIEGSHPFVSSGRYSVGEGGADYEIAGLVAQMQAFLDDTSSAHRAFSTSGTAVPMLFCIVAGTPSGVDSLQGIRTNDHSTPSELPILEVDYGVGAGVMARSASARLALGRGRAALVSSSRGASAPAVTSRGRTK